jgi:hypothetical protein
MSQLLLRILMINVIQLLFQSSTIDGGAVKEQCRYGGCSNENDARSNAYEYNYGISILINTY